MYLKFHENPSKGGGSCSMRTGQTDGRTDEADSRSSQFGNEPSDNSIVSTYACQLDSKCLYHLR